MVAVGLYTSDYLSDGYLPVHMDSATELADYLDHVRDQMNMATQQLWKLMAAWSRDQMIDAGMLVYSSVPRDLAHFAGVYEQDDWFLVEDRVQRFRPIHSDEYGGSAIAELVGLVTMSSQQAERLPHEQVGRRPRRDVQRRSPTRCSTTIEWTSTVGPIRGGSSTLPPKTGKYTTTRGKLTQDECNAAARAFTPELSRQGQPVPRRQLGQAPRRRSTRRRAVPRHPGHFDAPRRQGTGAAARRRRSIARA